MDSADAKRWTLCGHLAGPWVGELRHCWRDLRRLSPRRQEVVDLTDVTFVDEAGETLLADMQNAGVEFVAAGVENKHLLAHLKNRSGRRPLRRCVEYLSAFQASAEAGGPERGEK